MRIRTFVLGCALAGTPIAGLASCMSSGEGVAFSGSGDAGHGGGGGGGAGGAIATSTSVTTGTTGTTGTGTTTFGTGGGGGGGGNLPDPPIEGPDAGADAADAGPFTCEGLDMAKPVVLYLSADDSNSMGSPVQARELLRGGFAPGAIRTYEFLNYYRIAYPAPPSSQLGLFAEAEPAAIAGELNLQLGVRSFNAVKPRRAMTITLVLDTSGSMQGPAIERERAAVKAIAASLAQNDVVSMVTWNSDNLVVLDGHVATGPNDPAVVAAANALEANGGTDLHNGLLKGYALATANYGETRLNRLVLISDGGANIGVTDENLIGDKSQDADKEGIYLVGIGAGPAGGYNDILMDTVTDRGRGAYVYLDEPAEAKRMFVDRFDETMEIAARAVQVELTLPWYFKIEKFFGEEYSTNPEEVERQHLAPSDTMVFNQVLKACDAAMINDADPVQMRVTWKTPLTYQDQEATLTTTVGDLLAADKPFLPKGKAIVAYAEALKLGTKPALHDALTRVTAANVSGTDPELTEIAELIALHPAF